MAVNQELSYVGETLVLAKVRADLAEELRRTGQR